VGAVYNRMTMNKQTILLVAGVAALVVAGVVLFKNYAPATMPGKGEQAVVYFPNGAKIEVTWEEVFRRAQEKKAYMDRSASGGWMYLHEDGTTWGKVVKPTDPAPVFTPTPAP